MFFNVIDHLKRQIDRLFKGKADLVDGKVPDDQLPERQVGTVAWDDVKGKPTEFPPAEHGHEDLQQLIGGVSAAVTQLGGRVEYAETAAASAVGMADSAQTLARTASAVAGDAELEARNAASDAGTALEKAEEALNLAVAVDGIVIKPWDPEREYAVSDLVTREGRIWMCKMEGQFDSWNARRWRMFVADSDLDTALEYKLGTGDRAADSAKLGGVEADEYALKSDISADSDAFREAVQGIYENAEEMRYPCYENAEITAY